MMRKTKKQINYTTKLTNIWMEEENLEERLNLRKPFLK